MLNTRSELMDALVQHGDKRGYQFTPADVDATRNPSRYRPRRPSTDTSRQSTLPEHCNGST